MRNRLILVLILAIGLLAVYGCSDDNFVNPNAQIEDGSLSSGPENPAPRIIVCGNTETEEGAYRVNEFTSGTPRVLVMAAHFSDTPVENEFTPTRMTQLDNIVFGATNSVAALYSDASSGQLTLEGDVFGPFDISLPSDTSCDDHIDIAQAVADEASLVVPDFEGYDIYAYVFPYPNDCQTTFGIGGHGGGNQVKIWVWNSRSVWAHEFGHVMGFNHAGTPDGGEYADYSCIMSTSWKEPPGIDLPLREPGAYYKNTAAWFDPARYTELTGGGTYSVYLAPAERDVAAIIDPAPDQAMQLVKVDYINQDSNQDTAYLSYRRSEGAFYPVSAVSDLMDATHVHKYESRTNRYAVLHTGEVFEDGQLRVTPVAGGDGVNAFPVQVEILEAPPGVDLADFWLTVADPAPGVVAASTDLTITNNAPSGSSTTYSIIPSVQSGFAVVPAVTEVTLAPQASTVVQVDIVPDASIVDGKHDASVRVEDISGTQGFGADNFRFVADFDPPTVPADLDWSFDLGQVTVTWSKSTDNASGVDLYEVRRNGIDVGVVDHAFGTPQYVDADVASGVLYQYEVRAVDNVGHPSAWSSPPLDVEFDCGQGAGSAVPVSAIYTSTPPTLPFAATFGLDIENLDDAGCGTAEFLYRVTAVGSAPIFDPLPTAETSIVINGGDTVSDIPTGMMFQQVPGEGAYQADVRVRDASTIYGTHRVKYVLDWTSPSAPTGLLASWSGLRVTLTWHAATDVLAGVKRYDVYKNGVLLGSTGSTAFVDNLRTINPGQTIVYQVKAIDRADNVGPFSNTASVTFPNLSK